MGRDGEIASVWNGVERPADALGRGDFYICNGDNILLPAGSVKLLAEMSSFAALLAFLSVNVVLIVLRYRMPDHPRPFRYRLPSANCLSYLWRRLP